jgi:TonB family protein
MSKTRLISSLAAALGVLVAACWLVTSTFPLAADSADSPGITVDLGGATLLHRPPVLYPEAARKLGVQGTVVVQAKLDSSADVSDALVVSGPDELRKEALRSVLNWHFALDAAGSTRLVSISFQADAGQTAPAPPAPPRSLQKIQVGGNVQSTKLILQPRPVYPPLAKQARIQGVVKLHALIAVDGTIADLSVIGGHPLLVPSALEAVRQWVYSPTYLNGNPTEVETEIDVNYTLAP